MENLVFDLNLEERPVTLTGKDGSASEYTLKEMTGRQRDTFLNNLNKKSNFVDGQLQGLSDYTGVHASLLSLVLFEKESGDAVTEDFVQGLPARVTTALFTAAQELNGLANSPETEEKAKND